jgi:hypothetical protein
VLHHVALEVRPDEADGEVAFWALLGFEEVATPPALGGRTRWVQRGDRQIHLLFSEDPVVPPKGHCAVVGDPQPLRDAGYAVTSRERHWGAERSLATTPAGHRVEVMAAPPPG